MFRDFVFTTDKNSSANPLLAFLGYGYKLHGQLLEIASPTIRFPLGAHPPHSFNLLSLASPAPLSKPSQNIETSSIPVLASEPLKRPTTRLNSRGRRGHLSEKVPPPRRLPLFRLLRLPALKIYDMIQGHEVRPIGFGFGFLSLPRYSYTPNTHIPLASLLFCTKST